MKIFKNIFCAVSVVLCTAVASLYGAELQPNDKVKLVCCGNEEILLEVKYAQKSVTLKNITDDMTRNDLEKPFPQMPIRKEMLELYIIPALIAINDGSNELVVLDSIFKKMPFEELAELIINANYLDIKPLFDRTTDILTTNILSKIKDATILTKLFKKITEKKLSIPKVLLKMIAEKINDCKSYHLYKTLKNHNLGFFGDAAIKVVDTLNNILLKTVNKTLNDHAAGLSCISPDGKKFFSSCEDNSIKIWDIAGNICLHTLHGHTDRITSVCISPDGKTLFSGACDQIIKIWNLSDLNKAPHTLNGNTCSVESLCVSPDGKTLFSGFNDGIIKIWDLSDFDKESHTFNSHTCSVASLCVSPDGKTLFSGFNDGIIKIWDLSDLNKDPQILNGHTYSVMLLKVSPDGKELSSTSIYDTVMIWKMASLNNASITVNIILQAWLITQLTKQQESEPYVIFEQSEEEKIWNELPEETKALLKNKLSKETQQRLDKNNKFPEQQPKIEKKWSIFNWFR